MFGQPATTILQSIIALVVLSTLTACGSETLNAEVALDEIAEEVTPVFQMESEQVHRGEEIELYLNSPAQEVT